MTGELDPGFYDIPADAYHQRPEISQSGLKLLLDAPAKYRYDADHPSESTSAQNLGTAAHACVLGKGAEIVTVPTELLSADGGVRTKAAREWKALALLEGKTVVSGDELKVIKAMAERIREHPVASALFGGEGVAEQAMIWRDEDTGVMCRGLTDWLTAVDGRATIVDYKTARHADADGFSRAVWEYGYHIQDTFYRAGHETIQGAADTDFIFVVQETTAPYLVAVYRLDDVAREIAEDQIRRGLLTYQACIESGKWPGYATEIQSLSLPGWVESMLMGPVEVLL